MLRAANLTARTAVLVAVGVITFGSRWPPGAAHVHAQIVIQITAFALAAALMAAWALVGATATTRERYTFLLPWILAAIALISGVAAVTRTGGNFIDLGVLAHKRQLPEAHFDESLPALLRFWGRFLAVL